jgi:hypothetical protein
MSCRGCTTCTLYKYLYFCLILCTVPWLPSLPLCCRSPDPDLVAWLRDLGLDGEETMTRVTAEDLTLRDLLELVGRDDLRRLGLKAGPELRIWRAILAHRGLQSAASP